MGFIIVWRDTHRDPHIDLNDRGFKEDYDSFEDAKAAAEYALKQEGSQSPWYFDYQIYQSTYR